MKKALSNIWNFTKRYVFKNISAILIAGFVISYLFIVDNNYLDICENDRKIRTLQQNIEQEKESILSLQHELQQLHNNPEKIERIAREKYYMQQAHEDVYRVVTPSDTTATHNNPKTKQ